MSMLRFAARLLILLALILPLGSARSARADDKMSIGGFIGGHIYNRHNELGQADEPDSQSIGDSLAFGVRVSRRLIDAVSVEGELGIMPGRARADSSVDVVQLAWRAQGLLHPLRLSSGRIIPFWLVGAGGSTSSSSNQEVVRNDTDFLLYTGLGTRIQVDHNWGVRVDARVLFPPSTRSGGFTTDWEAMIGLYKTFPDAPPPPAARSAEAGKDAVGTKTCPCPDKATAPAPGSPAPAPAPSSPAPAPGSAAPAPSSPAPAPAPTP